MPIDPPLHPRWRSHVDPQGDAWNDGYSAGFDDQTSDPTFDLALAPYAADYERGRLLGVADRLAGRPRQDGR